MTPNSFLHYLSRMAVAVAIVIAAHETAHAEKLGGEWATEVNAANAALRQGRVADAMAGYERAAEMGQGAGAGAAGDELSYNTAVAAYRQGNISRAENLFQAVAASSDDDLAANARFNLGNCRYAAALQIRDSDRKAAIQNLEAAIADFRGCLAVKDDADARANIELAAKLIQQLKDEEKQPSSDPSQQDKDQQDESSQEQEQNDQQSSPSQNAEEDENKASQSAENNSPQDGADDPTDNPDENQAANSEKQQDSPSPRQQDQNDGQSTDAQQQPSPNDEASPQDLKENQSSQSDSDAEQSKEPSSDPSRSHANEDDPSVGETRKQPNVDAGQSNEAPEIDQPTDAAAEDRQSGPSPQSPEGNLTTANTVGDEPPAGEAADAVLDASNKGMLTEDEARKMLQAIRDRDMLRRLRRQAAERARRVPVDKDW